MILLKKVAKVIAGLLLILVLILWFAPAPLIKWALEKWGSEAVGAQVDVADVDFSWFPLALSLNSVAITNPGKPMFNAVEVARIATELDWTPLLKGQIYLDRVQVKDIAMDTPRTHSGAIAQSESSVAESSGPLGLPDFNLPDPKQILAKEKALYQSKIQAFEEKVEQRKARWEAILAELPDESRLEAHKKALDEVDDGNVLEKLAKARELRKRVKKDLETIKNSEKQLRGEYEELQAEYQNLRRLSQQSTSDIIKELGLSDSVIANLGNALVSGMVDQWIEKGFGYYQLLVGGSEAAEDTDSDTIETMKTEPQFLARLTEISGRFEHLGEQGEVEGTIRNLSDAPALYSEPIFLDIKAQGEQLGRYAVTGTFDHRANQPSRDDLTIKVDDRMIKQMALSNSKALQLGLQNVLFDLDVIAQLSKGSNLDINLDSVFSNMTIAAEGAQANEEWAGLLLEQLRSVGKITIDGRVTGRLDKPNIKLNSNINDLLKSTFTSVAKSKVTELNAQLRTALDKELQSQLAPLKSDMTEIKSLLEPYRERENDFAQLLKLLD